MKKIIIILALACTGMISAQVAIGKQSVTDSAILEFGTDAKGILLNIASDVSTMTATAGTIAFDGATGSFRYYDGSTWSAVQTGGIIGGASATADTKTQGAIIGATSSAAQGTLILEHPNRALILPKMASGTHKILTPVKGLMYYDTTSKTVNVYNGNAWTSF